MAEDVTPAPTVPSGWRAKLDLAATMLMIAAGVVILFGAVRGTFAGARRTVAIPHQALPVPEVPVSIEGAPQRGKPAARVALIEHSDFECPFCGQFERDVLPLLTVQYVDSGRVRFVFRDSPIPGHPHARPAAEAAACAAEQGQFWAAHDLFFGAQDHLQQTITSLPFTLHLAGPPFEACLVKDAKAKVDADVALSKTLGVKGTPSFFIGIIEADGRVRVTRTFTGTRPLAEFQQVLDAVLKEVPNQNDHDQARK